MSEKIKDAIELITLKENIILLKKFKSYLLNWTTTEIYKKIDKEIDKKASRIFELTGIGNINTIGGRQ